MIAATKFQPFAPSGQTELRFGYTLEDLRRLAVGVAHKAWGQYGDPVDHLQTAWSAIAEALYASETAPARRDLFQAGMDAMGRYDADDRHHHGIASSGPHA